MKKQWTRVFEGIRVVRLERDYVFLFPTKQVAYVKMASRESQIA